MADTRPDTRALADALRGRSLPPVADWNPTRCGSIDIRIARDGAWYHEGTQIRRASLYKLFSTVLRRDGDDYYLVTPVEKLRIQVDDVPFQAVSLTAQGAGKEQLLVFTTNCDDTVACSADHPLRVAVDPATGEPSPYVLVRARLEALLTRAVFYQLVDLADLQGEELGIWSGGCYFTLGSIRE